MSFADRLWAAVQTKQTPAMVGLDPRADLLPQGMLERHFGLHGYSLKAVALAYEEFCSRVLDVVAPLVPAVKVQVAFFEALGPAGGQALWHVIRKAQRLGLLVVADAKRNDIGSTAEAYAAAWLSGGNVGGQRTCAWDADALTVNPYLGMDSLEPFLNALTNAGDPRQPNRSRGLFVLVKTSNPGAAEFQDLEADGAPLYVQIARAIDRLNAGSAAPSGYGPVGAVVGATHPNEIRRLRPVMPRTLFLLPGYGAQGGRAADLAPAFDERGFGAVVNSSRGIIFAYREPAQRDQHTPDQWEACVASATEQMIRDLAEQTPAGRLRQERPHT